MLSLDAGHQSGHRADPVPLAVRSGRGRAARRRRSPAMPRQRGATGRRHRGLRALQSVRRSPTTARRSTISHARVTATSCARPARVPGLRLGRHSQLFELPGGPVRFALGAEYRREKAALLPDDPFVDRRPHQRRRRSPTLRPRSVRGEGGVRRNPDPDPQGHAVLRGADGQRRGARRRTISGAVGTVWAYNAGVDWAPVRDIRFRGNYGRVGPRSEPVRDRLPAGRRTSRRASPIRATRRTSAPTRTARPTARRTSVPLLGQSHRRRLLAADRQRQQPGPGGGNVGLAGRSARSSSRASSRACRSRSTITTSR